jgi:hypothetical protein
MRPIGMRWPMSASYHCSTEDSMAVSIMAEADA